MKIGIVGAVGQGPRPRATLRIIHASAECAVDRTNARALSLSSSLLPRCFTAGITQPSRWIRAAMFEKQAGVQKPANRYETT